MTQGTLRAGSTGPELHIKVEQTMIIQSEPVRAWCQSCRSDVTLVNVRPWPEGVLVVGECPRCETSLASRKPVGWTAPEQRRAEEPQRA